MARILIVDDSQVIRDLLTDFLGELGHRVELAEDGVEGLAKARSGEFDLCICDLHLPRKNGFQLLSELGDDAAGMQFIFTDSLPDDLYDRIKETTQYQCIRKPFDLTRFREVVERALDRIKTV
jgi:two-component system nitrogen regulation response regulator NtrX